MYIKNCSKTVDSQLFYCYFYYLFLRQSINVRNKNQIFYVIEIKTLTRHLKLGRKCDEGFEKKKNRDLVCQTHKTGDINMSWLVFDAMYN